jgi:uncharacterized protein (DUF885 family)
MIAFALLVATAASADSSYKAIEKRYVRELLSRNPVVSTYLGGAGLDPSLARADGDLRDWSPDALAGEDKLYSKLAEELEALDPATLSPANAIDRQVILRQIAFMQRQNARRKYWQRSLDTYVNEAFRGIDWYLQGMTDLGGGRYGTEEEWRRVIARVDRIPKYLEQAQSNLAAGEKAGNVPDWRMVERDGLQSSAANALFFGSELPEIAKARTTGQKFSGAVLAELRAKGAAAGTAFTAFKQFLETTLAKLPKKDRFALGAYEYDWALQNNLAIGTTSEKLFEDSWPIVLATRDELITTAQRIAEKRELKDLKFDEANGEASTRAVIDLLSQEYPRTDAEMLDGYRDVGRRLVEFARKSGLFDVPAEYKLEVTAVPPVLEASIDGAAYYPAPTFKDSGVGRFYVAAPHGDEQKLKQHNRSAMAYLAAHEGFPGHDWHYKVMTEHRDAIGPVRWLTPGEVEGSASMWQDSAAAEGWGLYAEHLMSEPAPQAPEGFYTLEERLYQLRGQLLRDLRVRVDIGLHTGRLGFDQAVDLVSVALDFLPGSCTAPELSPVKKSSCDSAWKAIFRYSKWPTQAITYRLGKDQILALRARADKVRSGAEGRKKFHMLFMQQGTVPPSDFADLLLAQLADPQK